jgi:pyruvate formate lyase activating enzyme
MNANTVICPICPHHCELLEGQLGRCRARVNHGGKVELTHYGRLSSIALDPIEKKPFARFHPGSYVLSIGFFGCNFKCPFCQNAEISMRTGSEEGIYHTDVQPKELVEAAQKIAKRGNLGLAYTYNEPLTSYEFVLDTAKLVKEAGLLNVIVTNGMICPDPMAKLLPYVDAMNIDLKGFSQEYYDRLDGDFEAVKATIAQCAPHTHVEVTTLVVPDWNDSDDEIDRLSAWLATVSPEIPLHLSRFFPMFRLTDREATPPETIYRLQKIAQTHLKYVYTGNL